MGDTPSKPTPSVDQIPDYYSFTPNQVFESWETIENQSPTFIKKFVKTLDPQHRLTYWKTMANPSQYTEKNPDIYNHLQTQAKLRATTDPDFAVVLHKIDLDVQRTFPNEPMMTSSLRETLREILEAFAILVPRTGYCQGMSFLAGQILLITKINEDALWIFTYFMKDLKLYGLFSDGVPLLKFGVFCVEKIVTERDHNLAKYFGESAPLIVIVGQWLSAMFTVNFNSDLTLRIWDMFLLEGFVWLIKVCAAEVLMHAEMFVGLFDDVVMNIRKETINDTWKKLSPLADGIVFGEKDLVRCKNLYDSQNKEI
ncbi:Growth hormone-regulated TBC protein [Entamoeba marina]